MSDSRIAITDYDTAKEILDLLELRPKLNKAILSVFKDDDNSFFTLAGRDDTFIVVRFNTKTEAVAFANALTEIFKP